MGSAGPGLEGGIIRSTSPQDLHSKPTMWRHYLMLGHKCDDARGPKHKSEPKRPQSQRPNGRNRGLGTHPEKVKARVLRIVGV